MYFDIYIETRRVVISQKSKAGNLFPSESFYSLLTWRAKLKATRFNSFSRKNCRRRILRPRRFSMTESQVFPALVVTGCEGETSRKEQTVEVSSGGPSEDLRKTNSKRLEDVSQEVPSSYTGGGNHPVKRIWLNVAKKHIFSQQKLWCRRWMDKRRWWFQRRCLLEQNLFGRIF